ncbi:hypothetical protein ACNKHO_23170 [Shigella flexneri]
MMALMSLKLWNWPRWRCRWWRSGGAGCVHGAYAIFVTRRMMGKNYERRCWLRVTVDLARSDTNGDRVYAAITNGLARRIWRFWWCRWWAHLHRYRQRAGH